MPAAREEWSIEPAGRGRALKSKGSQEGEGALAWSLDARFGPGGALESLELQARPVASAQEVTTVALRCYGGRAYGTAIPPGGVPEKFETRFADGSAVRAFSTALDGLSAVAAPLQMGHGRRLVVIALDAPDLRPHIRDGMLLARSRSRAKTPEGEEWCVTYEFRWADAPGRAETVAVLTKGGLVLRAERERRSTALASFSP